MPIPAIEPFAEPDGQPVSLANVARAVGLLWPTLSKVASLDAAGLDKLVRKLVSDGEGEPLFQMLEAFDDLAKKCRGLGQLAEAAHARLLLTADALAKETAPAGEYVGLGSEGKRRKPAKRRAVQ